MRQSSFFGKYRLSHYSNHLAAFVVTLLILGCTGTKRFTDVNAITEIDHAGPIALELDHWTELARVSSEDLSGDVLAQVRTWSDATKVYTVRNPTHKKPVVHCAVGTNKSLPHGGFLESVARSVEELKPEHHPNAVLYAHQIADLGDSLLCLVYTGQVLSEEHALGGPGFLTSPQYFERAPGLETLVDDENWAVHKGYRPIDGSFGVILPKSLLKAAVVNPVDPEDDRSAASEIVLQSWDGAERIDSEHVFGSLGSDTCSVISAKRVELRNVAELDAYKPELPPHELRLWSMCQSAQGLHDDEAEDKLRETMKKRWFDHTGPALTYLAGACLYAAKGDATRLEHSLGNLLHLRDSQWITRAVASMDEAPEWSALGSFVHAHGPGLDAPLNHGLKLLEERREAAAASVTEVKRPRYLDSEDNWLNP